MSPRRALRTLAGGLLVICVLTGAGCGQHAKEQGMHLGTYPVDLYVLLRQCSTLVDASGIPLQPTAYNSQLQYHPACIEHYALTAHGRYLETKDPGEREKFLHLVTWLRDNLTRRGAFGVWEYGFDFPPYGQVAPWSSAIAQGLGISALLRAYELTTDVSYREAAELAAGSFAAPLSLGGIASEDSAGGGVV